MTGALIWARLSYRQQKWELLLVALAAAGVVAAMLYFVSTMNGMRAAFPECLSNLRAQMESPTGPPLACSAILEEWYEQQGWTSTLMTAARGAPLALGVILGAPLVAREIDNRTAQLAWSLSRSRIGWLARRIAFMVVLTLALLGIVAMAAELLAAAIEPDRNLAEDFFRFGERGLPIVAHGAGALMLGVLVGAMIGRVLPAVLVSAIVIGIAFAALSLGQEAWNRGEATMQRMYDDAGQPITFDYASMDVEFGLLRPDGSYLGYNDAYERGLLQEMYQDERGRIYTSEADMEAGRVFGHEVRLVVEGERYQELVLRDSLLWLLLGFVALGAASVVVVRRRPV